ncbi:unnamed protein product [Caenorhabditis angaria]|uniref:SHSP domain-containing protein n=1 Tax=Caenorhabditis angaria TaxID=860376 RepID=A0A9P1IHP4_9PELO|nr:unnamed protein product [Caenorhabditis angaria]
MTPYFDRNDQRIRSRSSSRASRHYIEDSEQFRSRPNYFPLPSRRVPSVYSNDTPTFNRKPDIYYQQQERPIQKRPGSPGPVVGAGEITNTEHGFTIELDVFRFRPEEIKVVLTDDLLSISGERFENAGDGQTLRRSFSRKYAIPEDIHLDSIRSHLTDSGLLVVNGSRKGWRETSISQHQPRFSRSSRNNVISTV